jgi:hypothetical protein
MRTIIMCIVGLGLMGWGSSFAAVNDVQTPRSQQQVTPSTTTVTTDTQRGTVDQRTASDTFRSSGTQSNINQRDVVPSTSVRTDSVDQSRGFTDRTATERSAFFTDRDRAGGSAFMVKFRENIKSDPRLAAYAERIDAIECGNRVILFGVVNSQEAKSNLELKAKNLGSTGVENRIMVI